MNETLNIIKYGSKTFSEYKNDIVAYITQAYPDVLSDFTDSSVGSMLVDINAGVANNLSMTLDRTYQETQLDFAQQRSSLLNIAKTMGFNIPPKRPSATVVDLTVTVPVLGDKPDPSYYPVLSAGSQINGGGKTFETTDIVDWSLAVSNLGYANRSIVPNYNSNGTIVSYNITKREVVVNGKSSIYKKVITNNDIVPFFSIMLPEVDILEIDSVILVEGTAITSTPSDSDFILSNNRYYEVDYLAQQRIFTDDYNNSGNDLDSDVVKRGVWKDITKKFIKEYTENGYCKLTFGSGDTDKNAFVDGFLKAGVSNKYFLDNFLNNTALGEKLKPGYTLFVKYRVGGGSGSNVGTGVLNKMGNHVLLCNGSRLDFVQSTIKSLRVNNPIPAMGGNDGLSTSQIRNLVKYNYASQNRSVGLNDYLVQIYKMPGRYGLPFRINACELNNKVMISILNLDSNGKLTSVSNSLLKDNISEYLSQYRMINDYVEVANGRVINIGFEIDLYVDNTSNGQIVNNVVNIVRDYFDINKHEINEDIFLGPLTTKILEANGVVNIIDIKVYNKVGGQYSPNYISQSFVNINTGEIKLINNTIYSSIDSMFEIKFPEKDIKVKLRKRING